MGDASLLITGGVLRPNGFELGDGKYYGSARLLRLCTRSGQVEPLLAVDEGGANFPAEHPNLEFTVGCVEGNTLWLAMDTEVRRYRYPDLVLERTLSHPCFQNVHSVAVRGSSLVVTSTGLDLVVRLDKASGEIQSIHQADGNPTWHRFSPDIDYRQWHSTRPHDCHPNHVFWLGDEAWVTRCTQEDAVRLGDPSQRIDLSGPKRPISVHDGVVREGKIWFTLVDGTLVIADAADPARPVEHIHLPTFPGYGGLRGWCRGICFDNDGLLHVGFSRLRQTHQASRLAWVRRAVGRDCPVECCSVLSVDLVARRIVADHRIELGQLDALYGIMLAPA